jgi:hypothetical protein
VKQTAQPVAASAALQIAIAETSGTLNGPVIGPTIIYDTNAGSTSQEPILIASCRNGTALAGLRGTTFGIVPGGTQGPLPPEKCGVYGDHHSLFVATRSATGFVVQAKETVNPAGVTSPTKAVSGTFGYRVVAKRTDSKGERLAKVAPPTALKRPTALNVPKTPEVKTPDITAPTQKP